MWRRVWTRSWQGNCGDNADLGGIAAILLLLLGREHHLPGRTTGTDGVLVGHTDFFELLHVLVCERVATWAKLGIQRCFAWTKEIGAEPVKGEREHVSKVTLNKPTLKGQKCPVHKKSWERLWYYPSAITVFMFFGWWWWWFNESIVSSHFKSKILNILMVSVGGIQSNSSQRDEFCFYFMRMVSVFISSFPT